MVEIAKVFLLFLLVFLVVYVIYYCFTYKNMKKFNRKKIPLGIKYLMARYKLDIVKLGFKRVYSTLIMVDSIIVATLFTVTMSVDNVYVRLLVAFLLVFPLFAGLYHLVAMYYIKESE